MTTPAAGSIDPVVNPTTGEVRYAVRARVNGVRNRYGIYNTRAEAEARLAAVLKSAGPAAAADVAPILVGMSCLHPRMAECHAGCGHWHCPDCGLAWDDYAGM